MFNFVDFPELDRKARSGNLLVGICYRPANSFVHPVVQSSGLNGPSVRRSVEIHDLNLQGRGSEVLLLSGDGDAGEGAVEEANSNRKTVAELLSLNPHDANWYKGCSIYKKGLKPTLHGFECANCNETEPIVIPSYKLNVVIEDTTGRAKIFLFGSVAEQILRHTPAELVEESSSNQILLPAPLRGLLGRRYVFQVVISEQTFRTGQLCFQARKVFAPPTSAASQSGTAAHEVEVAANPDCRINTPPPEAQVVGVSKSSTAKGKEVSSSAADETGTVLGKRSRSARKELFSAKKEKASYQRRPQRDRSRRERERRDGGRRDSHAAEGTTVDGRRAELRQSGAVEIASKLQSSELRQSGAAIAVNELRAMLKASGVLSMERDAVLIL
ncbi:hypothetical protein PR202_ga20487 [Eleusine coracana subsp. coracana]|uniref:Replication factor A C-terminal domain-containing protein n=1 Tax=Eleusine coracana subsp. coracana TaxID=191504 RepID=A0AAV5CYG2_ELECO|nr:hypothetical protein PR202_ga20487 [Eleusine coracana subsp. coracana]